MAQRKLTIKASDITRDLRSGMTISQLMGKYSISQEGLRLLFRKLLNAGVVTKEELDTHVTLYRDTAGLKGVRKWLRTTTTFPVWIYDSANLFATGHLLNISEKGVCVKDVEAVVGEPRNFIVRSGLFGESHSVVFESRCRWVGTELSSERKWVAGFEIVEISNLDSGVLRNLIHYIQDLDIERRINASMQATFGHIS
jgi:hypothetical protein